MTPAEIAAKLTPAQVRALRLKAAGWAADCSLGEWWGLMKHGLVGLDWVTKRGRAVLAALNAKGEPK